MTVEQLQQLLNEHDNGKLYAGSHMPGTRKFCALEFDAIVRQRAWSDEPLTLPDLRPLNDALWSSDEVRTAALLPVMAALWDWSEWTSERQQRWASRVAIETVRQIISALPGLTPEVAQQCRDAHDLSSAAEGVVAEAAAGVAEAAWAATARRAGVAPAVAWAAAAAGLAAAVVESGDSVLQLACTIWIEAAAYSEKVGEQ